LSCRAIGYPEVKYRWEKDGKPLKSDKHYTVSKEVLNITDVNQDDRAVFKCIASNSFKVKDATQNFESSVAFNVRVKGKLAWLWPLIAIIVTAVLLAIIIIACEYRRKKHEQEAREQLDPEEED
jgi:flagellar biosynthesis/type III secretory pathway M-ring protein FliF/YscJ